MEVKSNILCKELQIVGRKYYDMHIRIVNSLFYAQLTNREIDVLAAFMYHQLEYGADIRKTKYWITVELNLSEQGLSNYLVSLCKKGCLISEGGGRYRIPEHIIPQPDMQRYQIKLVKKTANGNAAN